MMDRSTLNKPLTILTRSNEAEETRGHLSGQSRTDALLKDTTASALGGSPCSEETGSWIGCTPVSRSLASTPPPDEESPSQNQLIHGMGGLFPSSLPSRASILTLGSDCASNASVVTDVDGSEDLPTPKASRNTRSRVSHETPARTISTRNCIVVQTNPLTPSPSPRHQKRAASPSSTPQPTKRSRFGVGAACSEDGPWEPLRSQAAFHHARQRTAVLAVMNIFGEPPRALQSQAPAENGGEHPAGRFETLWEK